MKELKRTWIHLFLLVVAATVAYLYAQPKDPSDAPLAPGELELWQAKAEAVTRIAFDDDKRRVVLERAEDKHGAYYRGKVEPLQAASSEEEAKNPHAPKVEASTFLAVTTANQLAKTLASFRARRSFGVVGDERMKEFGFDKPDGTLRVTVAGKEHVLLIGAATAGSTTRYARDVETKIVYVIDGSPVSDMKGGSSRLAERAQHEWKWSEPDSISVSAGGKSKRLVRSGTEGRRFWADANVADQNDETSGNWLSKVERLRPVAFLDALPTDAKRVVRIEYRAGSSERGFAEVHQCSDKENPYLLVTEQLRLPATLSKATVAQVVDDLASVLPGADLPAPVKDEPSTSPASSAAPASSSSLPSITGTPESSSAPVPSSAPTSSAATKPAPSSSSGQVKQGKGSEPAKAK